MTTAATEEMIQEPENRRFCEGFLEQTNAEYKCVCHWGLASTYIHSQSLVLFGFINLTINTNINRIYMLLVDSVFSGARTVIAQRFSETMHDLFDAACFFPRVRAQRVILLTGFSFHNKLSMKCRHSENTLVTPCCHRAEVIINQILSGHTAHVVPPSVGICNLITAPLLLLWRAPFLTTDE